jgi:hypothetical protein
MEEEEAEEEENTFPPAPSVGADNDDDMKEW